MGWWQKLKRAFSFGRKRQYEAARLTVNNERWLPAQTGANTEIRRDLPWLRARSRDLMRNSAHARRAVMSLVNNVVGDGLNPKSQTGNPDLDKRVQSLWSDWSKQCSADGVTDWNGVVNQVARATFESGECLVRQRPRRSDDGLSVPLQLQVLEGDFLDTRRDTGDALGNNEIVDGVEFNGRGARAAYWLFNRHPGESGSGSPTLLDTLDSKRITAGNVAHVFMQERPGQVRGVPWLSSVILALRNLDDYTNAEIIRKKIESCLAAFVQGGDPSVVGINPAGEVVGCATDSTGAVIEEIYPGMIAQVPEGRTVTTTSPATTGGYGEFVRTELTKIAAGLGLTYELLSGDMSQTNYSSIKAGLLEFRRMAKSLRKQLLIHQFANRVWGWWTTQAIGAGLLPPGEYPVKWSNVRFGTVEPVKEVTALKERVANGFASYQDAMAEHGLDWRETLEEIAEFNEVAAQLGITLPSVPSAGAGESDDTEAPELRAVT